MADLHKYKAHEILNKVLNSAETGLQVDIVSGAEYAEDSAHTSADTGNFILGVRNDTLGALGGADGDYVPFQMNASGALYVEVATLPASTSTIEVVGDAAENAAVAGNPVLVGGRYDSSGRTLGDGDVGAVALDADGAVHIADGGNTITVDGTVTANLGSTDNAVLDAIAASLALIDNAIPSGNELQVDVVASLPAGSNAIGKLAANSGVDIGDVDVTSLPASTNTIEVVGDAAEDAAVAGNPLLAGGRYDATQRTLDDGDAGALAIDPSGALYTREYTGQDGAVYTTSSSDAIVPPTGKAFIAITMLEDTTFDSSGGLVAVTATKWFNTADAAGDLGSGLETTAEGSGGKQISNSVTFPQGLTIFGRWNEIDVNSGSVIAYIGDY
tara:strand:+ start:24 stop:1181 length:1158 start_codon:yes stop_codon:yes gene_type:complete